MDVKCHLLFHSFTEQPDGNLRLTLTIEVPRGGARLLSDDLMRALVPETSDEPSQLTLKFVPEMHTPLR